MITVGIHVLSGPKGRYVASHLGLTHCQDLFSIKYPNVSADDLTYQVVEAYLPVSGAVVRPRAMADDMLSRYTSAHFTL